MTLQATRAGAAHRRPADPRGRSAERAPLLCRGDRRGPRHRRRARAGTRGAGHGSRAMDRARRRDRGPAAGGRSAVDLLERAAAPPARDRGGARAAGRGEGRSDDGGDGMARRDDAGRHRRGRRDGRGDHRRACWPTAPSRLPRLIASHPRRDRRDAARRAPRHHHGGPQRARRLPGADVVVLAVKPQMLRPRHARAARPRWRRARSSCRSSPAPRSAA